MSNQLVAVVYGRHTTKEAAKRPSYVYRTNVSLAVGDHARVEVGVWNSRTERRAETLATVVAVGVAEYEGPAQLREVLEVVGQEKEAA